MVFQIRWWEKVLNISLRAWMYLTVSAVPVKQLLVELTEYRFALLFSSIHYE